MLRDLLNKVESFLMSVVALQHGSLVCGEKTIPRDRSMSQT